MLFNIEASSEDNSLGDASSFDFFVEQFWNARESPIHPIIIQIDACDLFIFSCFFDCRSKLYIWQIDKNDRCILGLWYWTFVTIWKPFSCIIRVMNFLIFNDISEYNHVLIWPCSFSIRSNMTCFKREKMQVLRKIYACICHLNYSLWENSLSY